jgi:hypothetical protein
MFTTCLPLIVSRGPTICPPMPPLVSERNHRGYVDLRNVRVLLEEARGLSRNLAYHRRTRLETKIGYALDEVDRQIAELRSDRC